MRAIGTTSLALVSLCSALAACLPHTVLRPAPLASASVEVRREYYARVRPQSSILRLVTSYSRRGGRSSSIQFAGISLADSTPVFYSEDLLSAVRPDSLTAQSVGAERQLRSSAALIAGLSLLISGVGTVGTIFTAVSSPRGTLQVLPFVTFLSISVGGLTTATVGGVIFASQANVQRERAFYTFDQSLREQLNLCGDDSLPGDCADLPSNPRGSERPEDLQLHPLSVR